MISNSSTNGSESPETSTNDVDREVHALIVGGGPSGLALAYELQGDTLVLEKEDQVGGLCRSITHEGGVFDIGGHSFHTPHTDVYELISELMGDGLGHVQRDARVYSHGTLIPYPFQKFYDRLPDPDVVRACEEGLQSAAARGGEEPTNFEEYIVQKFGEGIAEHFMLPYNRKLWARDISKISCEWTSERVAAPKGESENFDTSGGKRKPLQPDQKVGYPREGGFEEFFKAFEPHIPGVEVNAEVASIDPVKRIATTRDGRRFGYRFLVSTMPLPILARLVEGTPEEIIRMTDELEYMSLRVALILTRKLETSIQRIYSADPEVPPHKIAMNHNSSESLRERPVHAIMAEVSHSPDKPVDLDSIAPKTIDFLINAGVIPSADDVLWTGYVDVKYAYPVYTHKRPGLVQGVKDWLAQHDIYSVGRFGDWAYVNSDKCVARGLELGRELREIYPEAVEVAG